MVKTNAARMKEAERSRKNRLKRPPTAAQKARAAALKRARKAARSGAQKKRDNKRKSRRRREIGISLHTAELNRVRIAARRLFDRMCTFGFGLGVLLFSEFVRATRTSSISNRRELIKEARRLADKWANGKPKKNHLMDGSIAYLLGGRALAGHLRRFVVRVKSAKGTTGNDAAPDNVGSAVTV